MTKKFIVKLLVIATLFMTLLTTVNTTYAANQKVYEIYTAEDLQDIRKDIDGIYILKNDIDLSTYGDWETISSFEGKLYGNGYTISNLTMTSPSYNGVLFSSISNATWEWISIRCARLPN